MKRIIFILLVAITYRLDAGHLTMALQKALELKLVQAKFSGLGGFKGYCINMDLKNFGKDSLVIMVEAGRRLDSKGENYQDILIVKDQLIVLSAYERKSVAIKGYCCQAKKASPLKSTTFDAGGMADTTLVKLARMLSDGEFTQDLEQSAVWAVSDKAPLASISGDNDSTALCLRRFVAEIRGEEVPWYVLFTRTYTYPNGVIMTEALSLHGTLRFRNENDSYATLSIYDSSGVEVGFTRSEWIKAAEEKDYSLDVPLKGLAKGKYSLEIKTPVKKLVSREFEI